jgi:hypothetical protein
LLLVEALFGLIAEPAPLQHRLEERRHLRGVGAGEVRRHVRQHVQPHQIGEAKRSGPRPADSRAGERIHLFDGQIFGLHQPHRLQHDEDADAVGDEVWRIAREHHFLAQAQIANWETASTAAGRHPAGR